MDTELKTGDEVYCEYEEEGRHYKAFYVVLQVIGHHVHVMCEDGTAETDWFASALKPTGRYFPEIEEVLNQMGEQK